MKARHFIIPVIALLAACQQMELETELPIIEENTEESEPADSVTVWSFTLQANKGEGETRALDLINEGATLNAYWKNTEKVKVYKGGTLLGTLDVTPGAGEKPTKATLSGSITTAGLAPGDILTLRTPGESWNYTGQVGTLASIETDFDHANASVIIGSVDELNHTITTTGTASFQNQQSIYRFGFKTGGEYFDPKVFTVSAAGGKLVQSMSWTGSAWTADYGDISVTPASAPGDHFYYVSLRNDQTSDDTYNFTITGSDDALYMASKNIPNSVLDVPGKFISAKSINAVKPDFAPASGEVSNPAAVL
jgi:hypothetical protein